MLLYSLMLSDVDSKTYEYGMLRALGFRKRMLVGMIVEQSFGFSLPGIFFGVIIAWILNILLREIIFINAQNAMTYELTTSAIVIGVTFGLVMPVIANYLPIRVAMDQTLRNSLDLSKRSDGELGVKVKKLESIGIETNQLIIAILLIVIGFSTYYVIPYAFLNGNMALVTTVLNLLLVLIIIGMTLICVLFFPLLEQALLWVLVNTCCRRDRRLTQVI